MLKTTIKTNYDCINEMMIDDIALFIHIVKQGGVTAAADYLSVPAATVSRRLQRLEQRVGEKLLKL